MNAPTAQDFSQVFFQELYAVEARRRHWRIEQFLGFKVEASLPPAADASADPPPQQPPVPTQPEVDAAKQELAETRAAVSAAGPAIPFTLAKLLHKAKNWERLASRLRDAQFQRVRDHLGVTAATFDTVRDAAEAWEQSEYDLATAACARVEIELEPKTVLPARILEAIQKVQRRVNDARAAVERARNAGDQSALPTLAKSFFRKATHWERLARPWRDHQVQQAKVALWRAYFPVAGGVEVKEAWAEWDRAERILTSATSVRAGAARQLAKLREGPARVAQDGTPEYQERVLCRLRQDFDRMLQAEVAAESFLKEFCATQEPLERRATRMAAKKAASEPVGGLDYLHLAVETVVKWERLVRLYGAVLDVAHKEQQLFKNLSLAPPVELRDRRRECEEAQWVAEEEVQRATRYLNTAGVRLEEARREFVELLRHFRAQLDPPPVQQRFEDLLKLSRGWALDKDLLGLSLSGGGIRSGTFALGFLQGLAQLRLLGCVDYLSTVSGGGFLGAWLAAWVHREGSLVSVERQLSPNRVSQSVARRAPLPENHAVDQEPEPVRHLREFSRYLSPRLGVLAVDTWTLGTIYLRNLFINALFIVPLALAVVLLWRLFVCSYSWALDDEGLLLEHLPAFGIRFKWTLVFLCAAAISLVWILIEQEKLFESFQDIGPRARAPAGNRRTTLSILAMVVVAASGSWIFSVDPAHDNVRRYHAGGKLDRAAQRKLSLARATNLRYFGQTPVDAFFHQYELDSSNWWGMPVRFALLTLSLLSLSVAVKTWRWWYRLGTDRWRTLAAALRPVERWWRWLRRDTRTRDPEPGQSVPLVAKYWNWRGLLCNLLFCVCFGIALYLVLHVFLWPTSHEAAFDPDSASSAFQRCLVVMLGPPLFLLAVVLGGFGETALASRWLSEYEREWRSRLAAWLLWWAVVWLVFAGATLFVPWAWHELEHGEAAVEWGTVGVVVKALLPAVWAAVSGGGVLAASRGVSTNPAQTRSWWLRLLVGAAPGVFLLGLLAGVSLLSQRAVDTLGAFLPPGCVAAVGGNVSGKASPLEHFLQAPGLAALALLFSVALACLFGWRISVNRFSMHMLFANRLVRCYLGASRRKAGWRARYQSAADEPPPSAGAPTGVPVSDGERHQNEFTGFDPKDNFPLAELRSVRRHAPYAGPYPLFNTALNCVADRELVYQDRKADAFVLTPAHCGSARTGYAATPAGQPAARNLSLGRAMTISGAAVDPNMSVAQSGPLTALMTLFNVRLGWWLENPAHGGLWQAAEPSFGWLWLYELLGLTDERNAYVHLSDGGHYENLGVYELIRRRCRFIIVVDAGTDQVAASDNMAALLRLVRSDFGVPIDLDTGRLQMNAQTGHSLCHCAVGRIRYDEVDDQAVSGVLVYVQAGLTGDEPPDLLQYAAHHRTFPRQSTLNQFFNETQFECYRALGHHVALEVFGEAAGRVAHEAHNDLQHQQGTRQFFAHLQRQWYPPPPCTEKEWLGAAEATVAHDRAVAANPALLHYNLSVYPEIDGRTRWGRLLICDKLTEANMQELRAISTTLQVMELSWYSVKLDKYHGHPLNRGWMNTFRRWTSSALFHNYWPVLRSEYSEPFVRFCERFLNLQPTRVVWEQCTNGDPRAQQVSSLYTQFLQEWSDQLKQLELVRPGTDANLLKTLVEKARVEAGAYQREPFLWLLFQQLTAGTTMERVPCGIVCAATSERLTTFQHGPNPRELELFVYLVGAYRTMGIGNHVLPAILSNIETCLTSTIGTAEQYPRRLTTFYPCPTEGPGGREEQERWMSFFFNHGFRRRRQPDRGPESRVVVLKYELGS